MGRRKVSISTSIITNILCTGFPAVAPLAPLRDAAVLDARPSDLPYGPEFGAGRVDLLVESPDFEGGETADLTTAENHFCTFRRTDELPHLWGVGRRPHGADPVVAAADVQAGRTVYAVNPGAWTLRGIFSSRPLAERAIEIPGVDMIFPVVLDTPPGADAIDALDWPYVSGEELAKNDLEASDEGFPEDEREGEVPGA